MQPSSTASPLGESNSLEWWYSAEWLLFFPVRWLDTIVKLWMETRRDGSKRRAITQAFVSHFTQGWGEWKEWLCRPLSAPRAWRLLSNRVLPKTNISSTVIMKYILHLISGSGAWLWRLPEDVHEHQLVTSFQITVWILISVRVTPASY